MEEELYEILSLLKDSRKNRDWNTIDEIIEIISDLIDEDNDLNDEEQDNEY